jgi:hypothetical protein
MSEPEEVAAIRYVAKYHDVRRDMQLDRRGAMNVVAYLDTLTAERDAAREELTRIDAAREAVNGVDVSDVIARVIRRPCESASPCGLTGQEAWALYFWGWNEEQAAKMAEMECDRLAACVERVRGCKRYSPDALNVIYGPTDTGELMFAADILAALEGT